ncbi:hypothetical protein LJC34_06075 [Oscillospiraceae bacterium OttesenSCG-928-G22]|nr:hypothetical protein [Oscillospiraceae bacterium OttesenSCG-928-G22]
MTENGYYNTYNYGDRLRHGESAIIEHRVVESENLADMLTEYTHYTKDELTALRAESTAKEDEIFARLRASLTEWETQAAQTMLYDRALEYVNTLEPLHTSNQWEKGEYGDTVISNMVYKMSVQIYEETHYDRETKTSTPVAWQLSWYIYTNAPHHQTQYPVYNNKIAGQDRKRFTDKAAMEKYLEGRKKAYAHLFTEICPPIPQEHKRVFSVNGLLLPGYTLETEPQMRERLAPPKKSRSKRVSR